MNEAEVAEDASVDEEGGEPDVDADTGAKE
jgi:hypothetical protein